MSVLFVVFIPVEDNPSENNLNSSKENKVQNESLLLENNDDCDMLTPLLICENAVPKTESKSHNKDINATAEDDITGSADAEICEYTLEIESENGSAVLTPINDIEETTKQNEDQPEEETSFHRQSLLKQKSQVEVEVEYVSLEQALQNLLGHLIAINTDVWQKSDDENYHQITFLVENEDVDYVLTRLTNFGIGSIPHTSVSIFPASYHNSAGNDKADKPSKSEMDNIMNSEFVKSVKSRLTVAQVAEAVKSNAKLTFDFLTLMILASLIAALGLVENSSVILVASMLVSPLMGPILGGIFGLVIRNGALWRLGVRNEIFGLILCIIIGFIFGIFVSAINHNGNNWGGSSWPTSEMQSRGMLRSLWVGVLIALPSGAGVALSVLGGNTSSLVGVAISASLLPPAVNCGMLLACSILSAIDPPDVLSTNSNITDLLLSEQSESNTTASSMPALPVAPHCLPLVNNEFKFYYSCNMSTEALILAVVSLTLTLLNILCIFIMGVFVLKIKEVAPHTAVTDTLEKFWKSDIKVARETYKTLKTTDPKHSDLALLAKKIASEEKEKNCPVVEDIVKGMEADDHYKQVIKFLENGEDIKALFKDEYLPYSTVGPTSNIYTPTAPGMPSSPTSASDKNQFTWMGGLRKRNFTGGGERPQTAGILETTSSPFKFPTNRMSWCNPAHERKPRGIFHKMASKESIPVAETVPKSQSSGRFEITTVAEEKSDSHVKFKE